MSEYRTAVLVAGLIGLVAGEVDIAAPGSPELHRAGHPCERLPHLVDGLGHDVVLRQHPDDDFVLQTVEGRVAGAEDALRVGADMKGAARPRHTNAALVVRTVKDAAGFEDRKRVPVGRGIAAERAAFDTSSSKA